MLKKTNGFTLIEGLLIVVVIGLLGIVGFQFYQAQQKDNQKSKPSKTKVAKKEKKVPEGWTEFHQDNIRFYHPSSWQTSQPLERNEVVALADNKSSTLKIAVYSQTPRIYYSVNAPFFCQLDNGNWIRHSRDDSYNDVAPENDSCSDVRKETVNGQLVYTMEGGALGRFQYIAAIKVDGGYLVIADYRDINPDNYDAEIGKKEELKQSVNSLTQEITKVNQDMRRN